MYFYNKYTKQVVALICFAFILCQQDLRTLAPQYFIATYRCCAVFDRANLTRCSQKSELARVNQALLTNVYWLWRIHILQLYFENNSTRKTILPGSVSVRPVQETNVQLAARRNVLNLFQLMFEKENASAPLRATDPQWRPIQYCFCKCMVNVTILNLLLRR